MKASRLARAPNPADLPLRATVASSGRSWNLALVCFVRTLGLFWIAKGLLAWAAILGAGFSGTPFESAAPGFQAITVYFSVIDVLAGVGLWLCSAWGGILWLLAAMSHLIFAVFFPRFLSSGAGTVALLIFAMMIYLTLSWLAAVEE